MPIATAHDALYIAAKAPRPGFAKTRLGRRIGHPAAIGLYRAFLCDLGARLANVPARCGCTLGWYITPPDAWGELAPILTQGGTGQPPRILAQGEGDWTARQDALFAGAAARGEARTVLVASDSPQLTPELIADAFRQLDRHDLVFGPVHDGGYYLIGMRGWHNVLRGIPMSTGTVLQDLMARARSRGLSVGRVAPLFDIDEADDLEHLRWLVATRPDLPATCAALREYGLLDAPATRPHLAPTLSSSLAPAVAGD
jgi:rSAM/selenodomain-associated transferase 1